MLVRTFSNWPVPAASKASVCLHVCNSSSISMKTVTWRGHSTRSTGYNHLHPKDTISKVGTSCCAQRIYKYRHIKQAQRSVSCKLFDFFNELPYFHGCETLVDIGSASLFGKQQI
jgi:hypothetical protein